MTALDLLTDFRRAGVELFADAGRLRFRTGRGVDGPHARGGCGLPR